jgi:arsenical pump membrane protein
VHLGPASLAASVVGYIAYRHVFSTSSTGAATTIDTVTDADEVIDPRAFPVGIPVVVFVLVGFTLGDVLGVPGWAVAAVADVVLVLVTRQVPVRSVPVGAAALATTLGVLAAAAAPGLGIDGLLTHPGAGGVLVSAGASVVGATTVNNLPAFLVAMPTLGDAPGRSLWAVLYGVNVGPVLMVTGSLAALLWLDMVQRLGVDVDARDYRRVGWRVGVPALLTGLAVLVLTG